jgi:hypothetical protein
LCQYIHTWLITTICEVPSNASKQGHGDKKNKKNDDQKGRNKFQKIKT